MNTTDTIPEAREAALELHRSSLTAISHNHSKWEQVISQACLSYHQRRLAECGGELNKIRDCDNWTTFALVEEKAIELLQLHTARAVEEATKEMQQILGVKQKCAHCSEVKFTPYRFDSLGGYVCLTCVSNDRATLQKQCEELRQLSGKGRYCPQCQNWLLDPDPALGETCGSCFAPIEYKRIALLRGERDDLRTRAEVAEKEVHLLNLDSDNWRKSSECEHADKLVILARAEKAEDQLSQLQQDVKPLLDYIALQEWPTARVTLENFLAKHKEFSEGETDSSPR